MYILPRCSYTKFVVVIQWSVVPYYENQLMEISLWLLIKNLKHLRQVRMKIKRLI